MYMYLQANNSPVTDALVSGAHHISPGQTLVTAHGI